MTKLEPSVSAVNFFLYLLLLLNGLVIAFGFHVFVAGLSVKTHEFESAIWVYRDVMTLGRFPVSIYREPLHSLLLTILPIGILVSIPADQLLGLLSLQGFLYAFFVGVVFHILSQAFWRSALREYTSISS